VEDLTGDRVLRDEDEDIINAVLVDSRNLFDSVVVTFADDEPGLTVDNVALDIEVDCPSCVGATRTLFEVGETACLRVTGSIPPDSELQWSKVGEGDLVQGRFQGVNCASLEIPFIELSDAGTYQCTAGPAKAVIYSVTIDVATEIPVAGIPALGALSVVLGAAAVGALRRRR
jgi:hypothetical protein